MSPVNYTVIFGLLTSGYLCLKTWNYTHFRVLKFNSQELFLASGAVGTVILFIGTLLHDFLSSNILYYLHLLFSHVAEVKDNSLHSLIIGLVVSSCYIGLYNKYLVDRITTVKRLIYQNNDGIELMLLEAMENTKVLCFTLNNKKVYVGLVITNPFSTYEENKSFQILPLLSGFRDNAGLVNFTTNYSSIYDNIFHPDSTEEQKNQLFSVSLTTNNITTCSFFDIDIYKKHFKK